MVRFVPFASLPAVAVKPSGMLFAAAVMAPSAASFVETVIP